MYLQVPVYLYLCNYKYWCLYADKYKIMYLNLYIYKYAFTCTTDVLVLYNLQVSVYLYLCTYKYLAF